MCQILLIVGQKSLLVLYIFRPRINAQSTLGIQPGRGYKVCKYFCMSTAQPNRLWDSQTAQTGSLWDSQTAQNTLIQIFAKNFIHLRIQKKRFSINIPSLRDYNIDINKFMSLKLTPMDRVTRNST